MNRWSAVLVAAAMLAPSAAQAQKPSNNVHTRSAETYLVNAEREPVIADKAQFLTKALEAALAGTQASPDNPRSWLQAGQAYLGLKDWAGADSAFARAESLYPEYAEEIDPLRQNAWIEAYNSGVTALQAGDMAGAKASLEQANMLFRKRPEAMVTLGSLYVQEGNFAAGEATFKAALAVLRGPELAKQNEQQRAAWAEDELTVSMRLAGIYAEQGNFAAAEQLYRDLLVSQPGNAMARANLAIAMSRAGKTEEAAEAYRELLSMPDLPEVTLFNIGIGLFRAQDFARAATAFDRVLEINPVSHESLYNLGQSLYAQAGSLETERASATDAREQAIQTELTQLNQSLRETSEQLLSIDPTNRNAMMMLAQAQRSLAELATGAAADALRNEALATLEAHQALKFEISGVNVVPGDGTVQVLGTVTNIAATPGATLSFRFSTIDRTGAELSGQDITVTAPATGETTNFEATLPLPEESTGWKYVVKN